MKSKILLKILVLILFPSIIYGQDSIPQKTRRLHFYLGASLLTQKTDYTVDGSNIPSPGYNVYPSIDINLSIKPKRPRGWIIEYSNPLLGEILTNGILNLAGLVDEGSYLMDNTISSGLFGRMDFGKNLTFNGRSRLTAGFVLSDKFISGIYFKPSSYSSDDYRSPEAEGIFITPGIYFEIARSTARENQFSINTSLTQSVHNLWSNNSNINYKNHLFSETNLKILTKKGWYYKAGTLIVIPYSNYSPKFRLSLTIGHRIF